MCYLTTIILFIKHLLCSRLRMAVGETGLLPSWQSGDAGLDLMAKGKGQVTRFQSGAVEGKKVSGLPLSFGRFNGRRWRG